MTISFVNHFTPDARSADLGPIARWCPDLRPDLTPPYYQGASGYYYSYHFWGYSLFAVPTAVALRAGRGDERKALQISNAFLFMAALFCVFLGLPWDPERRVWLGLLTLLSPAFWFVLWPHPEVYSYALVTMALVFMERGAWTTAAVLTALASWQAPPVVFLVAFIGLRALGRDGWMRALRAVSTAAMVAAIPSLFFLLEFGTPSLLAKHAAGVDAIAVRRVVELFFDPSIGMLPYLPLTLPLFLVTVGHDVKAQRWRSTPVGLFVVLVMMATAAASTGNWNHGTSGPSRYVVWMLPLIFFSVVQRLPQFRIRWGPRVPTVALAVGVASQAVIVIAAGGFVCRIHPLDHTQPARFLLREAPSLYSPTFEIFVERTVHREDVEPFAVFFHRQRCRKALLRPSDRDLLEAACGLLPATVEAALARGPSHDPVYVNFPRNASKAPAAGRAAAAGEISIASWLNAPGQPVREAAAVTLLMNHTDFRPGSTIQAGVRIEKAATGRACDLYAGAVWPDRRVATLREDGGVTVRSRFVGLLPSMRTRRMDPCQDLAIPVLFDGVVGSDAPSGTYEAFVVLVVAPPPDSKPVRPGDVIAASVKNFNVRR